MIILSIADAKTVSLITPWGKEDAISYQGNMFLPTNAYKGIKDAIAACRRDLDAGLFSIIVEEANQVRVWCPLPKQMLFSNQTDIPNPSNTEKLRLAIAA